MITPLIRTSGSIAVWQTNLPRSASAATDSPDLPTVRPPQWARRARPSGFASGQPCTSSFDRVSSNVRMQAGRRRNARGPIVLVAS